MRLAPIVLRLRVAKTTFGNNIFGSAELDKAIQGTLMKQMAFVIPLIEKANANNMDNTVNQVLIERFAVIVALQNDVSQSDKTGITAYDTLHNIRSELFRALLNVWMKDTETPIYYIGGSLLDLTGNYLWYQFEFEFTSRIQSDSEGIADVEEIDVYEKDDYSHVRTSELPSFNKIYTNYILAPSPNLPYEGDLPLDDGYPDVLLPDDMAQLIDLSAALHPGGFSGRAFSSAFDIEYD